MILQSGTDEVPLWSPPPTGHAEAGTTVVRAFSLQRASGRHLESKDTGDFLRGKQECSPHYGSDRLLISSRGANYTVRSPHSRGRLFLVTAVMPLPGPLLEKRLELRRRDDLGNQLALCLAAAQQCILGGGNAGRMGIAQQQGMKHEQSNKAVIQSPPRLRVSGSYSAPWRPVRRRSERSGSSLPRPASPPQLVTPLYPASGGI